jgi:hypothetical protein
LILALLSKQYFHLSIKNKNSHFLPKRNFELYSFNDKFSSRSRNSKEILNKQPETSDNEFKNKNLFPILSLQQKMRLRSKSNEQKQNDKDFNNKKTNALVASPETKDNDNEDFEFDIDEEEEEEEEDGFEEEFSDDDFSPLKSSIFEKNKKLSASKPLKKPLSKKLSSLTAPKDANLLSEKGDRSKDKFGFPQSKRIERIHSPSERVKLSSLSVGQKLRGRIISITE